MVQNCALSGAFFVVVFGSLWSKIVLFLVLFLRSCLVDCGPKLCSFWCFFVVVFGSLWSKIALLLVLFCGRVW